MIRKFFPLDKNYLLEQAQLDQRAMLLSALIEKVKAEYEARHNPLRIRDQFFQRIATYRPGNLKPLEAFYGTLAGVFRYKHGDNQLELLWTGESHYEKYKADWSTVFDEWTTRFCAQDQFIQAILDLTVFISQNRNAQLAENRMHFVMLQFFELKLHKSRGILAMKVA